MNSFKTIQRVQQSQQGIGLPTAIFIITLMAVMAVAINQLVSQNAQTFEEEVNLTRAFYAAESGAGFIMNGIYPPENYPGYAGRECTANDTFSFDFTVDGLNQCDAAVRCDITSTGGSSYITIESTGTCGDVSRTIQVRTSY